MSNCEFFRYGDSFAVRVGSIAGIFEREDSKWIIDEYYPVTEWLENDPQSFAKPVTVSELTSETELSPHEVREIFKDTILAFEGRLPKELFEPNPPEAWNEARILDGPFRGRFGEYDDVVILKVEVDDRVAHLCYVNRWDHLPEFNGTWEPDFSEAPRQDELRSYDELRRIDPEEWLSVTGQHLSETVFLDNVRKQRELFLQRYPQYRQKGEAV
jgi:hypothetical protein